MASDDHNETFDELTINKLLIDPDGVEHSGELADLADTGGGDGSGSVDVADDGTIVVETASEIDFGEFIDVSDDGDGTVTVDAVNTDTDTHVTVENVDGDALVQNVSRIHAGEGLSFTDDGDGSVTLDATDDSTVDGPSLLESGTVDLSGDGDSAVVAAGTTATDAKIMVAYGTDDHAEIQHAHQYNPDTGEAEIYFVCTGTGGAYVGPATVSYDVITFDGSGSDEVTYEVVESGTFELSGEGDDTWIDTGLTETGTKLSTAYGVDDHLSVEDKINYDPNSGTAKVNFFADTGAEGGSFTGPATVSYDILHWNASSDGGGGDGGGDLTSALYEDFESSDWDYWTSVQSSESNATRTQDPVYADSYALDVLFESGTSRGFGAQWEPTADGVSGSYWTEMYVRYYMYWPEDFDFGGTWTKCPGVQSTKGRPPAGTSADGTNGWSARGIFGDNNGDVGIGYYVYHMDMPGSYGEYFGNYQAPKGQWHRIDQYVAKNTISDGSANADGKMYLWVNGNQEVAEDSMRFTEDESTGVLQQIGFYFGGSADSPQDQSVYMDEVRLDNDDFAGMMN